MEGICIPSQPSSSCTDELTDAGALGPESAEQEEGCTVTPLMSLQAIWDARDEAPMLLQQSHRDVGALLSVEWTVSLLASDLGYSVEHYSAMHGRKTPEGRTALTNLKAAREDLQWVTAQRRSVTSMERADKLRHALRSSVNGLALLRWSMG
jgi:hypothetical protein